MISPPRISFSHDLGQADVNPTRDASLLDMSYDFEFSISRSFKQGEPSSADELFSHGVIKPMQQPKDKTSFSSLEVAPKACYPYSHPPKHNIPEDLEQNNNKTTNQSKSFWGFKRSNSLNQENKRSLLCSLPEFLKRSNSTGSAPNPKSQQKRQSSSSSSTDYYMSKSSSTSSNSSSASSSQHRMLPRPPSRKGSSNLSGNGVRISPVLNVPSPYISRGTAKLFCLSSFLYPDGNEKKQKK